MHNSDSRYMLFSAGGRRYAVDVSEVDEIAELLPEYPIPDSPRFLRGVVNIHGKLAAVLDLSMYLGTGPTNDGKNLLLLKMPGCGLAVIVAQMEHIIFASEIIASEPGATEFGPTVFELSEGKAALLDIDSLVKSVEKTVAS